jgi:O-succinylbenzoate synthase
MRLLELRLHHIEMPLVAPFTTSFMTQTHKRCFIVEARVETATGEIVTGWGENVALDRPYYSPEYLDGSAHVVARWLAPLLFDVEDLTAETVSHHLRKVIGNPMAKASVEMAILDAQLQAEGRSFSSYLGAVRTTVPSGVSVGVQDSVAATLGAIGGYLEQGYARIKLKIQPGADVEHVAAVRREFGDDLLFQVDANAAYTLVDAAHLRRLDEYRLLLIEQPLGEADIRQHAELAKLMTTPICLDESIDSAEAAVDAIMLGAAAVINVKPGRVGGYLEARRIHDIASAHGVAVWCGGMLETGIGRAANAALAALPGFTLPGDISGSDRFYAEDLVAEPLRMHDGVVDVPTGPGFGVQVDVERVERFRTSLVEVTR